MPTSYVINMFNTFTSIQSNSKTIFKDDDPVSLKLIIIYM